VGKRTPKASVMKKMWVQRILSTGSNVTTWPGGKSSSWCSWAFTKDMSEHSNINESAAVGPVSARFEAIFLDVDSKRMTRMGAHTGCTANFKLLQF